MTRIQNPGRRSTRREPAHSLLYDPDPLTARTTELPADVLYAVVEFLFEEDFNERQQESFAEALTKPLSLLWGPPGTGKTTVMAGAILAILEDANLTGKTASICIGANNWRAIDNLFSKVADLIELRIEQSGEYTLPVQLSRVRGSHSPTVTDPRIQDVDRSTPDARILADSLVERDVCHVVAGTWMQLGKLAKRMSDDRRPEADWFDVLFIDESSQLPVVSAAGYFLLLRDEGRVMLAGDHRQLGPIYAFEVSDTEAGLLDCVFTYMQERHGITPVNLRTNYRTNVEIADWPKARFYGQEYEAFFPERRLEVEIRQHRPAQWPDEFLWSEALPFILDPEKPIVVLTYPALTFTLSNPFEAQLIASLTYLLREAYGSGYSLEEFWSNQVGLVTPHRAQVSSIRALLLDSGAFPPDPPPAVDTVDRFQGQERDVILSSYAVADRDFAASEDSFILNPRRFNVTLTRARCKVVLVISNAILELLPTDADVAEDASHFQLFVDEYCELIASDVAVRYRNRGVEEIIHCQLRARLGQ